MKTIFKFVSSGLFTTIVTYFEYLFLVRYVSFGYAYLVCYGSGVLLNYFLHSKLVFENNAAFSFGVFLTYLAAHLTLAAIGRYFLEVLVLTVGLSVELAPITVIVMMLPVSFLVFRKIVRE